MDTIINNLLFDQNKKTKSLILWARPTVSIIIDLVLVVTVGVSLVEFDL